MTATATRPPQTPRDPGSAEDLRAENTLGVLRLGITVLLIAGVTKLFDVGAEVLTIVAILAMVMLHELGHFVTARWAGMKVTDFFVGFGPTIWSVKRGDTRFGVKGFPVGGFVRVIGMHNLEEVDPADEPYTYRSKTYWQRLRFASAGSFMHFVIAFVLMVVLLAGFGRSTLTTTIDDVPNSFTSEGPAAPAFAAGMRAGDKIIAVNARRVTAPDQAAVIIRNSLGKPVEVTVERGGATRTVVVTPVEGRDENNQAIGRIGIMWQEQKVRDSLPDALWHAGFEIKDITVDSAKALIGLAHPDSVKNYGQQLTKTGPADPEDNGNRLLSPFGLFRIAGAAADTGVDSTLFLLIAINIFVGIFNMIPLPPFDGGHVAVATYEAIMSKVKGRRHMIDMGKLLPVAYMVLLGLMLLTVSAVWLDLRHPLDLG